MNTTSEVSLLRLYLLRAMYVFIAVGLMIKKMAGDIPSSCERVTHGYRRWQHTPGSIAPGYARDPLSTQDAADFVL